MSEEERQEVDRALEGPTEPGQPPSWWEDEEEAWETSQLAMMQHRQFD